MLKDLIYDAWTKEPQCESASDTVKLISLVDFYLPFLPLERQHIRTLFVMRLEERKADVHAASGDTLEWSDAVLDLLVSKVETSFPPPHPLPHLFSRSSAVMHTVSAETSVLRLNSPGLTV